MLHQRECQRLSKLQFTRVNGTQMECCPHFLRNIGTCFHVKKFQAPTARISIRNWWPQRVVVTWGWPLFSLLSNSSFFGSQLFGIVLRLKAPGVGKPGAGIHPVSRRVFRRTLRKKTRAQTPSFPATPHKVSWKEGWIPKGLQDIKM